MHCLITVELDHLEVGHGVVVVTPARGGRPVAAARGAVAAPATTRQSKPAAVRELSK